MKTPVPKSALDRLLAAHHNGPLIEYEYCRGSWIYAVDGARYLDGSSGLMCNNIGHANKRVLAAMSDQASLAAFAATGTFKPGRQGELVASLTAGVGRPDDSVAFAVSGTGATELSISLARLAVRARGDTKRYKVLTATLGYHGNSAMMLALSGHRRRRPEKTDAMGLEPAFQPPYWGQHAPLKTHKCTSECAATVAEAIDLCDPETVAAVMIEPVNGTTGGAFVPPVGYLRALKEICAERGVLVIHDEVLTGLGRTGLPLGSAHWDGAEPDICVLSKGLGAGYISIGAVLLAPEIAAAVSRSSQLPMMGTMSANPLQAAVGLAVLEELRDIGALGAEPRGQEVQRVVLSATEKCDLVQSVRGLGYFFGIQLMANTQRLVLAECRRLGLLLYPFNGFESDGGGEGLIIAPPLNCSDSDIDFLHNALSTALCSAERLSS